MWQLIQDNFISHYHEYIGDLHHMLVALSKIQTFAFSWTPLLDIYPVLYISRWYLAIYVFLASNKQHLNQYNWREQLKQSFC